MNFIIINKGVPGANSSYFVLLAERNIKEYRPDMLIVMMGINDAFFLYADDADGGGLKRTVEGFAVSKLVKFFWFRFHEKKLLKEIYLERARYFRERGVLD